MHYNYSKDLIFSPVTDGVSKHRMLWFFHNLDIPIDSKLVLVLVESEKKIISYLQDVKCEKSLKSIMNFMYTSN